jgi:hypothetical protein
MSRNAPELYGTDVRCMNDADALFTPTTGLDCIKQDAYHRLTTDDLPGDDGSGGLVIVGWGFDVRRLLGTPTSRLRSLEPTLVDVLLRDERIQSARVTLTATTTSGVADILLTVTCTTALGPFTLIRNISTITADTLVGQA